MRFGTSHAFQVPPGTTEAQVIAEELERVALAEELGYDSVWVPEQHFFDYCGCSDALVMATHIAGVTSRVRIGTAVVNLSLTDPIRFAERASLLDHLSGGRVDLCVGRGYQWPQNLVFGVPEEATRPMFEESLDVVLGLWGGEPFGYDGEHFAFPPVQIRPAPLRPAHEVLLHARGGSTPLEAIVERGLPMALAQPFQSVHQTAALFADYVAQLTAAGADVEAVLDRAMVMVYALVAPTAQEARAIGKAPFEWHAGRLAALRGPQPAGEGFDWFSAERTPPVIADDDWAARCGSSLLYDDPDGIAASIEVLRQAGVRQVVPWMGVGGVAQEHVLRSMTLFAEEVMPRFR